jgi:hypothetical protein
VDFFLPLKKSNMKNNTLSSQARTEAPVSIRSKSEGVAAPGSNKTMTIQHISPAVQRASGVTKIGRRYSFDDNGGGYTGL